MITNKKLNKNIDDKNKRKYKNLKVRNVLKKLFQVTFKRKLQTNKKYSFIK